jgi:hypothetical protein
MSKQLRDALEYDKFRAQSIAEKLLNTSTKKEE